MRGRVRALVGLLVLVLASGCVRDEPSSPSPASPTSEEPTPSSPTPTPTPEPSPPTPEPTVPSGSPVPPQPRVVFERTFDFSTEGDPTGQGPKSFTSDEVGEEFGRIEVNVTFERASAGPATLPVAGSVSDPTVRVFDPDGEEVMSSSSGSGPREGSFPSKVGTYTVRFEGAGTFKASVVLTASS